MKRTLCIEPHICMDCKKETYCKTYRWACPWTNEDEDQMCDECLDKAAEAMYKFEEDQSNGVIV